VSAQRKRSRPQGQAPIVLAAGGTGGHVFPAAALARTLTRRGRTVIFVTDRRGKEFGEGFPDIPVHRIRAGRFEGGLVAKLAGLAGLALGVAHAAWTLRRISPAAIVGFGGHPSLAPVLGAACLGVPVLIHEQNAVLGRVNRLVVRLGKWVSLRRVASSFAECAGTERLDKSRIVQTGNPVRPAIGALAGLPYPVLDTEGRFELLILGGSQGARVFSDIVPAALALLPPDLTRRLRISQQARPEDLARLDEAYAELRLASGIEVELASFFGDVAERLARAHLVIARAGASTVAELAVSGRPAILVPYPYAMDDHQTANARALAATGGAWVIPQPDFTPENLATLLRELAIAPERLAAAAAVMRSAGRPDAAELLADLVLATVAEAEAARAAGSHPITRKEAA
jgi:UDP-N-acetylglucosamine--N-acetylmuramyl-(pentapeptide) pyrophosphoryl-undecaprenol N-acetylglucosamine transferase